MMYYVDIINKKLGVPSRINVFHSEDYDKAWDYANTWNIRNENSLRFAIVYEGKNENMEDKNMKKIEMFVKVSVDSENVGEGLYGEYLEKVMKQIEKDGVKFEDYAVVHHTSVSKEEMYYNYLMQHVLENNFDHKFISPMSFEEWLNNLPKYEVNVYNKNYKNIKPIKVFESENFSESWNYAVEYNNTYHNSNKIAIVSIK